MKMIHFSFLHPVTRSAARGKGVGTRLRARLNSVKFVSAFCALFGLGIGPALASDPVGVYAVVDKVVLEPSEANPERIQVWGAFAIAEGYGYTYKKAERGYLYYKLIRTNPLPVAMNGRTSRPSPARARSSPLG